MRSSPPGAALLAIAAVRSDRRAHDWHFQAAARYSDRGDLALANLRHCLRRLASASRRRRRGAPAVAAENLNLLDHGLTPGELLHELEMDAAALCLEKIRPRPAAGARRSGGIFPRNVMDEFLGPTASGTGQHWLDEEVPVYDTDISATRSARSRAIKAEKFIKYARCGSHEPADDRRGRHGGFLCRPSRCGCSRCCRMSTLHETSVAQQLMRWFLSAPKQEGFASVERWWLGRDALALLRSGRRLSTIRRAVAPGV